MATRVVSSRAAPKLDALTGLSRSNFIDRWIYVAMAIWLIAIVLVGFIPDSLAKAEAIRAGMRPSFPLIMHVHAVLMGTFLLLLLTQSWLAATGHIGQHRRLGVAVAALVQGLVVVGFLLAPVAYFEVRDALQNAAPEAQAAMQAIVLRKENVVLNQLRIGLLFPLFMGIALSARQTDPGLHKRMIFLATVSALPPAFARMTWIPAMPIGAMTTDICLLFTLSPMLMIDLIRNNRIHKAYGLWLAINIPVAILVYSAWDQPWWHATARQLFATARSVGLA